MQFRSPGDDDIEAIARIEHSASSPWSRQLIGAELQQANSLQFVAIGNDTDLIIGWCCARLLIPEAELLKITVTPQWRRSGAGTLLLSHLMEKCRRAGCTQMFLEVREKNSSAVHFYTKLGFNQKGRRERYYTHPVDHALILSKKI